MKNCAFALIAAALLMASYFSFETLFGEAAHVRRLVEKGEKGGDQVKRDIAVGEARRAALEAVEEIARLRGLHGETYRVSCVRPHDPGTVRCLVIPQNFRNAPVEDLLCSGWPPRVGGSICRRIEDERAADR